MHMANGGPLALPVTARLTGCVASKSFEIIWSGGREFGHKYIAPGTPLPVQALCRPQIATLSQTLAI